MDERDAHLRRLIETVQQQPKSSLHWRKAMNQLLRELQHLPGLAKSTHPDYAAVLNDTWMALGDAIQEFEPRQESLESSLTAWINLKLRLKFKVRELHAPPTAANSARAKSRSAIADFKAQARKTPLSLDAPIGADDNSRFGDQLPTPSACTLWELEDEIRQEQARQQRTRIGLELQHYIQTDPDEKLRQCHPQAHPDCHCQMLGLRLLLKHPPDRLANIAREYSINYHTLNWHWKNRGIPLLQAIAQNLGYQPDREVE
jgi:hypothetical protein